MRICLVLFIVTLLFCCASYDIDTSSVIERKHFSDDIATNVPFVQEDGTVSSFKVYSYDYVFYVLKTFKEEKNNKLKTNTEQVSVPRKVFYAYEIGETYPSNIFVARVKDVNILANSVLYPEKRF